jgi:4-amino-4-deoxy-L-arabinose transferase-like glycosyltransferase
MTFDTADTPKSVRWNPRSLVLLFLAWLLLQFGGIFSPGLLDDVDSIYIQIAREMLQRHDFVTPFVNGIRFFDKPPLMYWMAAGSMHIFGIADWAARLPLALSVFALLLAVYALGNRLFAAVSPAAHPDRGGFYSALAVATGIGPYLYTRFYIPDILIALWMTLSIHLFLIALERLQPILTSQHLGAPSSRPHLGAKVGGSETPGAPCLASETWATETRVGSNTSALLPCLGFAAVLGLNVLTKGLIGVIFPIGFVLLYLAITRQLRLLPRLHLLAGTAVFLAIAAPWHILAALRNPAIALPSGLGLPAHGGWAWFYLYNEHIARFLSKRIPHDYGQTPVWLFWLYLAIWVMPWATFLPTAIAQHLRTLRNALGNPNTSGALRNPGAIRSRGPLGNPGAPFVAASPRRVRSNSPISATDRSHEAALSLLLWAALVLGFFSFSARQEYYSLPALPALALMAGGLLAHVESEAESEAEQNTSLKRTTVRWSTWFLLPITTLVAILCGYFALFAPHPAPGATLSTLLASNPSLYNLSLGHIFDLTGAAMGLFRGPLAAVAIGMFLVGIGSTWLRAKNRTYAANLTLAAGMVLTLLAAHSGLIRFNPILGSKDLAKAIKAVQRPNDLTILDGEFTSGSTLVFYTGRPVHLINGRVNTLWYGSFWPDAPNVFETDASLHQLWASPRRIFLFTYNRDARERDLAPFGPTYVLAEAGGKTVLTNHK